jgi:hypothetical protein
MHFQELVPILQVAIGPVILISGIGLLLLSMTNRFGRVIDRSRQLADVARHATVEEGKRIAAQIEILSRRAQIIRMAITLSAYSALLAAILIILLFVAALWKLELGAVIAMVFIACMVSLIGSLLFFLRDINVSLAALKLDISG